MKSLIFITALSIFLFASLSQAGDDKKPLSREDFAYGMELSVNGRSAIYGLTLPAQVYQGCTKADLGDLRVFNAKNAVPHLLRPQVRKENKRQPQTLPFFPLLGRSGSNNGNRLPPDLHIATNSQGTIIDIRQGRTGAEESFQTVTSYIIDTAGLEHRAD
jgi:hypothetical protein